MTSLSHLPAGNTVIEDEMLDQDAFLAELADRLRTEGPSALDTDEYADLYIADMTTEEFIADLLAQYPADETLQAAA